MKDIARMQQSVHEETANDPDFTWWQKILNWLAEYMLSKITGILSLDEGVGRIAWYAVNYFWDTLVKKIGGGNGYINGTIDAYKFAFERSLRAYLNGDYTLIERLYKDITNL